MFGFKIISQSKFDAIKLCADRFMQMPPEKRYSANTTTHLDLLYGKDSISFAVFLAENGDTKLAVECISRFKQNLESFERNLAR